jgi:ATP-dependent Lon protease
MTDSAALKGSSSVWVGGEASIILLFMKHAKISDGILMFDEIDKLGEDGRSKVVQHALLHITDYTQNSKFRDLFLSEISHDLSALWFLFAMNDDTHIDPVLRDRLHIIDVKPYDRKEMEIIMEKYLLPRAIKDVGMNEHDHACIITADGKAAIFNEMDTDIRESGVRAIDGLIRELVCRINALRLTTVGPDSPLTYARGVSAITFPLMITQELIRVLIPTKEKKSISYIS